MSSVSRCLLCNERVNVFAQMRGGRFCSTAHESQFEQHMLARLARPATRQRVVTGAHFRRAGIGGEAVQES